MKDLATEFEEYLRDRWNLVLKHYTLHGERSFYQRLWEESLTVETSQYGTVERIDVGTDYEDGREQRTMILKIRGRFFKKMGYYDSWESSEWDGTLTEVVPVEKTVVTYESI